MIFNDHADSADKADLKAGPVVMHGRGSGMKSEERRVMKYRKHMAILLTAALLLCGCGSASEQTGSAAESTAAPEKTEAAAAESTKAGTAEAPDTAEDAGTGAAEQTSASAEGSTADPAGETTDRAAEDTDDAASSAEAAQTESSAAAQQELYEYNPHLYSTLIAQEVPQDHWESLYHLSDALRAGEDSFACSSREAYDWCMDAGVLANLIPAASMRISGKGSGEAVPFENGTGRIFYSMPAEEFVAREAEFEEMVTGILNSTIEKDDDDYEKCLKLYDYMETNYSYDYDGREEGLNGDGYIYYTFYSHSGQCIDFAGVYAFLLLQAGVEAVSLGCYDELDHEWTYAIVNGRGYHIDPTWALKSDLGLDELCLNYFMMDDVKRTLTGCPVDDLTVQLLPQFWASQASVSFAATDDRYDLGEYMYLKSLDEENKILYYYDMNGNEFQFCYGE